MNDGTSFPGASDRHAAHGFAFHKSESASESIRRVAAEEIGAALAKLKSGEDQDEAVHDCRRHFKRLRALLRLLKSGMGQEDFDLENACFRDCGRVLAGARDAKVALDTFDSSLGRLRGKGNPSRIDAARDVLQMEWRRRMTTDNAESATLFAVSALEAAASRVPCWSLTREGWPLIEGGLASTYKACRRLLNEARMDGRSEIYHEWRKRVKRHWHHLQMLSPVWPSMMGAACAELSALSGHLGDEHDLTVLEESLVRHGIDSDVLEKLEARRKRLRTKALRLGDFLFAETPGEFTGRIGHYWTVWVPRQRRLVHKK